GHRSAGAGEDRPRGVEAGVADDHGCRVLVPDRSERSRLQPRGRDGHHGDDRRIGQRRGVRGDPAVWEGRPLREHRRHGAGSQQRIDGGAALSGIRVHHRRAHSRGADGQRPRDQRADVPDSVARAGAVDGVREPELGHGHHGVGQGLHVGVQP
ncbi:hypothetical protein ABE10_01205, partial [Bacillus toyonensis]|nr:hypothetical protein [Bacillus toyonensis]